MKNILLTILALCAANVYAVNDTATFESYLPKKDSFLNGKSTAPAPRVFEDINEKVRFNAIFDTAFGGYWKGGFAVSSMTDTTNGTAGNLYSSANGQGAMGSQTYLIGNGGGGDLSIASFPVTQGISNITSFYVNNTTYARRVMQNGNSFSKKFVAADKDTFVLWVFLNNSSNDSFSVDLARFTHVDTTQNFILNSWVKVKLPSPSWKISFKLVSSDNGQFGMNTPNFFAIDNIETEHVVSAKHLAQVTFELYPNPTSGLININSTEEIRSGRILDLNGKTVLSISGKLNAPIDVSPLAPGTYILELTNSRGVSGIKKFIKE